MMTDEILTTIVAADVQEVAADYTRRLGLNPNSKLQTPKSSSMAAPSQNSVGFHASTQPTAASPVTAPQVAPKSKIAFSPAALKTRLNRALRLLRTTATVGINDDCLQVIFESKPLPDAEMMVLLVRSELGLLRARSSQRVKLFGRLPGAIAPAWSEEVR